MANHPSRNWRRVAQEAAQIAAMDWWHKSGLLKNEGPLGILDRDQIELIIQEVATVHRLGYEAGRASVRPPTPER